MYIVYFVHKGRGAVVEGPFHPSNLYYPSECQWIVPGTIGVDD